MFCEFLTAPLIGPAREENTRLVVDEIKRRYGCALQAASWSAPPGPGVISRTMSGTG